MGVSNLVVLFSIVVFYSFIVWGIGSLYVDDSSEYIVEGDGSYSVTSGFSENIFGVSTYQNDYIPPIVNVLIITPLNFLLVGCVFYFLRSGAS